jgi:hypothetical protein
LKSFVCAGNDFGSQSTSYLKKFFQGRCHLQAIVLSRSFQKLHFEFICYPGENELKSRGAIMLAGILTKFTELEELDLSQNEIGGRGVSALLPVLSNLQEK